MAAKKKRPARKRPPKELFVLFDANGENCGPYTSDEEARDDAYGPRFRAGHAVRRYVLAPSNPRTGGHDG